MTYSKPAWVTPLLILTSACVMASQAFSVHVHRVSRAFGSQVTDPLHSFSLPLRGESTDFGDVYHALTSEQIGEKRAKRTADEQKTAYQGGQDGAVTVDSKGEDIRYGVLLDAGSSSTKVKVYTYTPGTLPTLVPHVHLEESIRVKPGLGQYAKKPQELAQYLQSAVDKAVSWVPQNLHSVTPVYIMATAGLRTLEAGEAKRLLQQTQTYMLNKTINPFYFRPDHVSILSGEEEGVYAWLAVNYLLGFFSTNMTRADSVGVLEMGGGSMQIAFLPDTPLLQEEFQVYVGRRRFDLYAQSYLNLGMNYLAQEVRQQLLKKAQEDGGGATVKKLDSPCMLTGDVSKMGEVKIVGTGSPGECEQVLTQILKPTDDDLCAPTPCAIANRYQPDVRSVNFYGISAMAYAPKTLKAIEGDQTLNIAKLRQNAWNHCTRTLQQVQQSGSKPEYASSDCLAGLFIPLLLTEAMGFPNDTGNIKLARDIDGEGADWALGAMLQQLSMAFLDDLDLLSGPCPHGSMIPSPVAGSARGRATKQRLTLTYLSTAFLLALTVKAFV